MVKSSHVPTVPWPRYLSAQRGGGLGGKDEQPFLHCDLNKPLGLGLADGKNDAIFT